MSVPLTQALGADMTKRNCPECGQPAVSFWRLISLGGLRTAGCAHCGAKIRVSGLGSLGWLTLLTWGPAAGAILGAMAAVHIAGDHVLGDHVLIGGAAGMVLSGALFAVLYFRCAKLVALPRFIPKFGPVPP